MTKAETKRILDFLKSAREHITLINEALESTEHPMDALIGEHLDRIYSDMQRLEFSVKPN